jgi:hypothetical protein
MNDLEQSREPVDPALLDRLVDGELPEAQRRNLLSSLDGRPEGWRQCALAFLEAQSWSAALGQAAGDSAAKLPDSSSHVSPAATAPHESPARVAVQLAAASAGINAPEPAQRQHPATWTRARSLAMAASFLVTLSAGMVIQRVWQNQNSAASINAPNMRSVRLSVDGQTMEVPLVEGHRLEEVFQAEQNRLEQMNRQIDEMRRAMQDLRQQSHRSDDSP